MDKMMTVMEVEQILGDRMRTTLNAELTPEQRQTENAQTALVLGLAKQFINGADLVLRHEALQAKNKNLTDSKMNRLIGEIE